MFISILVILAVIAGSFWLYDTFLADQSNLIIYWAGHSHELSVAKLMAALLIAFLCFYIVLRLLKHLINMGKYSKNYREKKTRKKTREGLVQGLISLVEGDWETAESQLITGVETSEIPVLHYLGAARAAHMNESYERRDNYLKLANESTHDAEIAVSISQAEMQLYAEQLEQARAGLITLLDEHPKHHYAKKLLAKSYYKQEDWKSLSGLLPALIKQNILNEKESFLYETASLKGIFQMYANEENLVKLKKEWKKLPTNTRNKSSSVLFYCKALISAEDNTTANKLLTSTLNKEWDDDLIQLYGLAPHDNLNNAIRQAEKWLPEHDKNPVFLLSIARLYRKHQLWGKARNFFESSLNLAPDAMGYLEFAELLEETGENANAELCYKAGLYFCIHKKGQPLRLIHRETSQVSTLNTEILKPPVSDYPINSAKP